MFSVQVSDVLNKKRRSAYHKSKTNWAQLALQPSVSQRNGGMDFSTIRPYKSIIVNDLWS